MAEPTIRERESPGSPVAADTGPRWLSTREARTWRAFLGATTLLFDALDRELQAGAGMPLGYYEIMVRLSEQPDRRLRMSDLARTSLSSRSRLSHAVARLEEAGWVRREACPTDRRGAFAVLTASGESALAAAAPGHVESVRRHLLDHLTAAQVEQLGSLAEAVMAPLAEEAPGGPRACPLQA